MRRLLALALLAVGILGACSSDDSDATSADGRSSGGAAQVAVTMTNDGSGDVCSLDTDSVEAGPVTFTVTNESATGVTEFELLSDLRILGEKENLAPGLAPATFTLTLGGGDYEVYCPGATEEKLPFTVTGGA